MNLFSAVFVLVVAAGVGFEWWLDRRQLAHVGAHRHQVPAAFAGRIPLTAHRKAADYTTARVRVAAAARGYDALLLLGWTLGGGLAALDRAWTGGSANAVVTGTALVMSWFVLQGLLDLPWTVYRTFGIEQRFGYNRTSPRVFVTDLVKQTLVGLLLGAPLAALLLWLMQHAGSGWWLWAWGGWLAFTLALAWAWPNLIAPLFNRFAPLRDEALASRLQRLLARHGVGTRGVWVMDGSRRSGHGNAYFTGLGRQRRVVLFDTLLEQLEPDEIEAVVAHELGHQRHHHVIRQMLLGATVALGALALLAALLGQAWFFIGLGVPQPSPAAALLVFLLVAPRFAMFLQPLLRRVARAHEYQADQFAAAETDARALVSALVALYRDNASTLTPDPLYSAFHDTHPPAPLRVARLGCRGD